MRTESPCVNTHFPFEYRVKHSLFQYSFDVPRDTILESARSKSEEKFTAAIVSVPVNAETAIMIISNFFILFNEGI